MVKSTVLVAGLLAGLALAVTAATGNSGGATTRPERPNGCRSTGGFLGICVDPVGDVKGAAGPDIVRVREAQWGVILFRVTLAKGSRLTHGAAFTDEVSMLLTATGYLDGSIRRYVLTVSAAHPTQQTLRRLPNGKPILVGVAGEGAPFSRVHRNVVDLGVNLRVLGNPSVVGYRARAARVMHDGTPGSSDFAPNKGTGVWSG